jgi:hypothetical protein
MFAASFQGIIKWPNALPYEPPAKKGEQNVRKKKRESEREGGDREERVPIIIIGTKRPLDMPVPATKSEKK